MSSDKLTVGALLDNPRGVFPSVACLNRNYVATLLKLLCSAAPAMQRSEDPAEVAGRLLRAIAWVTQEQRHVTDLQAAILAYRGQGGDTTVLLTAARANTDPVAADFIEWLRVNVLPMAVRLGIVPAGLL